MKNIITKKEFSKIVKDVYTKRNGYELSSCCGAGVYEDMLICKECKEHCGIEYYCSNCGEQVDKTNSENYCRDCDNTKMAGQIYG